MDNKIGKKRIGIMSMQRIINYGSFLQAYGLRRLIENIDNMQVEFVDYRFEKDITICKNSSKKSLKDKIVLNRNISNYIKKKLFLKKIENVMLKDLRKIGIDTYNYDAEIDTLVIGSDEVFNCLQTYPVGYSRNLFGKGYEDKRVVSYAASFGHTQYHELCEYCIDKEIGEMLSKFQAISVRDDNSFEIVKKLSKIEAFIHVDPVLAYDFSNEIEKYNTYLDNYIVLYAYTNRLSIHEENYIKNFAKRVGKKIVSIGNYSAIADKNIACNPLFIFSYFKNADYVITDTFHGTIFSLKMNAKFCTIIRDSNRNKLTSLLKKFDKLDRCVEHLCDIERLYNTSLDYERTNMIIEEERKKTIVYLEENL